MSSSLVDVLPDRSLGGTDERKLRLAAPTHMRLPKHGNPFLRAFKIQTQRGGRTAAVHQRPGAMSKSLTGGLVPLGKRAGSNSAGSSTLSGGLIPLAAGRSTKTTPSLGRIHDNSSPPEVGGNIGGTVPDEEENPRAEQEGIGIGSGREKKVGISCRCGKLRRYTSLVNNLSLSSSSSSSSPFIFEILHVGGSQLVPRGQIRKPNYYQYGTLNINSM